MTLSNLSTIEDVQSFLPRGTSNKVTEKVVELIGKMGEDTGMMQDYMEEMFKTNATILKNMSSISLEEYISALRFVTLKSRMSNTEAWKITFPSRWKKLVEKDIEKNVHAHAVAYNKRNIVQEIEANMLIDFNRFYDWARHEAMMKQVHLMRGEAAPTLIPEMVKKKGKFVEKTDRYGNIVMRKIYHKVSPSVQQLASAKILEITAPLVEQTLTIKHAMTDESVEAQKSVAKSLRELAISQRDSLLNGAKIDDVQVIGNSLNEDAIDIDDDE